MNLNEYNKGIKTLNKIQKITKRKVLKNESKKERDELLNVSFKLGNKLLKFKEKNNL